MNTLVALHDLDQMKATAVAPSCKHQAASVKVVQLHKGAVWSAVNRTVVVYQRLLLFSLGAKTMFVLPGWKDTNQCDTQIRRLPTPPQRRDAGGRSGLPSFTKNSAM